MAQLTLGLAPAWSVKQWVRMRLQGLEWRQRARAERRRKRAARRRQERQHEGG